MEGDGSDEGKDASRQKYGREATTNYAGGLEYYITSSVPVRVGVYTNNDARPEIEKASRTRWIILTIWVTHCSLLGYNQTLRYQSELYTKMVKVKLKNLQIIRLFKMLYQMLTLLQSPLRTVYREREHVDRNDSFYSSWL